LSAVEETISGLGGAPETAEVGESGSVVQRLRELEEDVDIYLDSAQRIKGLEAEVTVLTSNLSKLVEPTVALARLVKALDLRHGADGTLLFEIIAEQIFLGDLSEARKILSRTLHRSLETFQIKSAKS